MAKRNGRKNGRQPKTADVSAGVDMVAQSHGGALLPGGQRGNRGGPGRPSEAWRAACAQALRDADALTVLTKMIRAKGTRDADRLGALKFLAEYGHGRPIQPIEGEVSHRHYVVERPAPVDAHGWLKRYAHPEATH